MGEIGIRRRFAIRPLVVRPAWRECCVIGRASLTRAYHVVSLLTDTDHFNNASNKFSSQKLK